MKLIREYLSKYNLFCLRLLARDMGVKSPTSLKKDVLIDKILELDRGEEKPYFSNRGAPPLKIFEKLNIDEKQLKKKDTISQIKKIKKLCKEISLEIDKLLGKSK